MDSTPKPTTPTYIGHYQLLEPIGRGGMGLVFRARDTRLEREVAIKCLRTELFEAHYIERFKREALLLAKLNHPNIVQIYDFIEAPEQLALVMELVDGQNLQTYLREHIVPMSQRLHWLTQIAEGLAIAHDAGIIHRDLKAENILINKRGQAKITDLGIAKSQDFNVTLTDHVAGSYCSMSPEQAMGENISFKSDLFSLGILAYQLLCGAHPFGDTGNKLQIMQRIISHPPTPPHKHNPELPGEFVDLLGQLLSKDPNKRPDNTHWVAAQFAKLSQLQFGTMTSDDTQVLAMPQPNTNNNGISRSAHTQDHPTFETRFVAVAAPQISLWKKLKGYIAANKIVVSSATVSLALIAGIIVWQLQPKPPKYVAVIPPKLTAEGMQESQQELVKGAVYDAIQQSVIQLDGYYLIPREEIADVNGDNEAIRKATAADELLTTKLHCKAEDCTLTLTRLILDNHTSHQRMRISDTKTLDFLTDNYLSVYEAIQTNLSTFYNHEKFKNFNSSNKELIDLIQLTKTLRTKGASIDLLEEIDRIQHTNNVAIDTLYKDVALESYHETNNPAILEKLEKRLNQNPFNKKSKAGLYNLFYLQVAKKQFEHALETIHNIKDFDASSSTENELLAYLSIAKNEYQKAIEHYLRVLQNKKTANNLYNIAFTYWLYGNNQLAKSYLRDALVISPNYYKSLSLYGSILMSEGNIEEAIKHFDLIANQSPSDIINHNNLGLCYLLKKEYKSAQKSFKAALDQAPNHTSILINYADTYNLEGNKALAEEYYSKVIELFKKTPERTHSLKDAAQAYAHLKEESKALEILDKLERHDPQNIETNYTAALIYTLTNNDSAAIFNIERTLNDGLHHIWFTFRWFDKFCNNNKFIMLMEKQGEHNRCPP